METPRPDILRFAHQPLRSFIAEIARRLGVPPADAEVLSDSLVAANLRGVDSHGLELFPGYVQQLREGGVDPTAEGTILSETGGCLLYDGRNGLGQTVASRCTSHAVRLAKSNGIGMVVARNSHHFGAAAYWSERMAKGGCIGISMSTAGANVAPWQGKSPRIGTNPIAMALPGSGPGGWLLDMATTTVAKGKVDNATAHNLDTIPAAWAFLDTEGRPTTDRQKAKAGWPSPLGGYKGSGLGLMAEILCAGLSGGPMSTEAPVHRNGVVPLRISHMFIAIDPERFLPAGSLEERISRLVAMIKSSEPAAGYDEILVAGDPEWREESKRKRQGVPLARNLWGRIRAVSDSLSLPPPPSLEKPASSEAGLKKE